MKLFNIRINSFFIVILIQTAFQVSTSISQIPTDIKNFLLDDLQKEQAIDSITNLIKHNYVFPDLADKMSEMLISNFKKGTYDTITNPYIFANVIGSELYSISNDKHLRVNFDPKFVRDMRSMTKDSVSVMEKKMIEQLRYNNYGFKKVERLNGNIGYLDFRMFADVNLAGETASSALAFLSNCDAIIIDLRRNGGGEPDMIRFICSYFFGPDSVHLNDIYSRKENKTAEYWTLSDIKGKRMPDVDLYVLTSKYTFSGAEEFAYDLQNLKRAVIIGEVTGGGANPGDRMAANEYFVVFVPTGRAINPYTKTNWEGTGVQPDIEVSQDKALATAMNEAIKKLLVKTTDELRINQLKWEQTDLEAQLNPYTPDELSLKEYAGQYNDRTITYENGIVYYERVNLSPKRKLIPLKKDLFAVQDLDFFRVQFIRDKDGKIIELDGLYDNASLDRSPKTK